MMSSQKSILIFALTTNLSLIHCLTNKNSTFITDFSGGNNSDEKTSKCQSFNY